MPNDAPVNLYSMTIGDFSKEKSTSTFSVAQQADYGTFITAVTDFRAAVQNLTDGTVQQEQFSLFNRATNEFPTASVATREDKYLIRYEDTTTLRVYTVAIPTAVKDPAEFIAGTDFLDISGGDPLTLKTTFEALAASPAGNPVNVLSIKYVGRNN